MKPASETYAGCVSGAIQIENYLQIIEDCGFSNTKVQKEKLISIPDEILLGYINKQELEEYKNSGPGIYSITVYAEKGVSACGCCCNCQPYLHLPISTFSNFQINSFSNYPPCLHNPV